MLLYGYPVPKQRQMYWVRVRGRPQDQALKQTQWIISYPQDLPLPQLEVDGRESDSEQGAVEWVYLIHEALSSNRCAIVQSKQKKTMKLVSNRV